MSESSKPERPGMTSEGADGAQSEDEIEALRLELDDANKKGEEYLQLLQRVQADFSNFRRRTEQQRQDLMNQAKGEVFLSILPVLDDFDRALEAMPEDYKNTDWGQGMALIARKLANAMEQQGLSEVEAQGKQFDPWEHDNRLRTVS